MAHANVTRAVILAAGQGSRLRPLTNERPKCLIEVAGETVLSRTVRTFRQAGISDVCIVVGYKAKAIRKGPP
jgi:L-glutamine-phosphate cytidylyltransferase